MISDYAWSGPATGRSQIGAKQTNALAEMASNPVAAAYNEMFGETGGFGGSGSGVSSGVNSGVSSATAQGSNQGVDYGAQVPGMSMGKNLGYVGKAAGILSKGAIPGLGEAFGAIGTLGDIETANSYLGPRGFQTMGFWDGLGAVVGSAVPFGLGKHVGLQSPEQFTEAQLGFGLGPAVQYDDMMQGFGYANFDPFGSMGFADSIGGGEDAFGGWGGYGSPANTGPGADIESEPGSWSDLSNAADNTGGDDFGGWGGYDGDMNDGPGADAEGEGW